MDDLLLLAALFADASIRLVTPLILAALAGMFAERSGIIDFALEGKMLTAAFAAGTLAYVSQSAAVGLLAGILAATIVASLHGFASITHRGNQVVSCVALNIVAVGLTTTLGIAWFGQGGTTPTLRGEARFAPIELPFAAALSDVPVLGTIYSQILSGHNLLVYLAFAAVPLAWFVLNRTSFGLRLRAVGENPLAVDTAGISVAGLRYRALLISGVLAGIGGAYLAIAHGAAFTKEMTAGKGFVALAALIFGKWRPLPTLGACFLFALLEALEARLQGVVMPGLGQIPVQLLQAMPYILVVLLLAGFVGKATAPKAIGVPFVKERK